MTVQIKVSKAFGPSVEGEALVMLEGFSPRYDLNRITGVITRAGHSVEGQSIRDKILVIPSAKGGVTGGWAFFDLLRKNLAPRALVFGRLNPVMVQGAILAGIPITEGSDLNLLDEIRSGDKLRVDPRVKTIERVR